MLGILIIILNAYIHDYKKKKEDYILICNLLIVNNNIFIYWKYYINKTQV